MNVATNIIKNVNANSGVRQVTKNILAALLLAAGCASAMANVSPQVKILSVESNGASPATIKFDADATDSDGSIEKVEFFNGTTLIGTATQAPYTFIWTGAATGAYSITAKATDNVGASSVSVATSIVVGSSSATAYYIHSDQIDTAKLITNDAGQVVWKSDLEPFGANLPDENPQKHGAFAYNNRFPGQYYDRETGLHYNYFRDYDPQTGRYVQSDPIGLKGGINTYAYVGSNPLSKIDPLGLVEIFRTGGVTFDSYPKGDGGNESARHGPHGEYHFHVNGDKNKVVDAYTLKPENPDALTKAERKALAGLSDREKQYIKKACREVFHNNHSSLPKLKFRYLSLAGAIFGPLMSNSVEEVCSKDYNNDLPEVCEK